MGKATGKLGHDDTGNRPVPTLVGSGRSGFGGGDGRVCPAARWRCRATVPCGRAGGDLMGGSASMTKGTGMCFSGWGRGSSARPDRIRSGWAQASVAVTEDGTLWTWGANETGRLGHGDEFMKEPTWFHTDERSRWVPRTQAFHNERSYEFYSTQHPWPADDRWVPAEVARASLGCRGRALPGAAGGARAGVCDGHALAAWRGLAGAVPGGEVGLLRMIAAGAGGGSGCGGGGEGGGGAATARWGPDAGFLECSARYTL